MPPEKKSLSRQYLASLIILLFLFSLMAFNFLAAKNARAFNATLPMQISQWITEKISWVKDYTKQNQTQKNTNTTSQIQQWMKSDILNQRSLKKSWDQTRDQLLKQLTNNILDWAKGTNGNTNFIIDWQSYLGGLTSQAGQNFINTQLSQSNMCSSFSQDVKSYVSASDSGEPSLQQQLKCPLSNYDAFLNDFTKGGWNAWLEFIKPAGNPFGAYMIAEDERLWTEAQAYDAEKYKLAANQGYKGDQNTPGIIQSYASQRASMMDLDNLLQAKDVNEYFSSVVDAFINRIQNQGMQNMQTGSYAYNQNQVPKTTLSGPTADLNYVKSNFDYFLTLQDRLNLLKENLQNLLYEQNLSNLNTSSTTLKISQTDTAFNDLTQIINLADQIIQADQNNNTTLVNSLIPTFKAALALAINTNGNGSLQILLETNLTDPGRLITLLDNFSSQVANEISDIEMQRGARFMPW